MVEVSETETQLVLVFGREPLVAFGIDAGNGRFVVEQPGEKGFRPPINAGKEIAYDRGLRTLRFEWEQADGRQELTWTNVDGMSWMRLREFARTHVPDQVNLTEE
jgi:hypothetical protein